MHLASTINDLSRSEGNVPVALFCLNERKKFIRVSESYEETIELVKRSFRVDRDVDIKFQTSSLDVCRGQAVVIDESAYPLMWTVLDEIHVGTDDDAAELPGTKKLEKGRAKEVMPTPLPTPDSTEAPLAGGYLQNVNMHDSIQADDDIYLDEEAEKAAPESEQEAEVKVKPANTKHESRWGQAPFSSKRSYDNLVDDKEDGGPKRQKFKPVSSALRGGLSPVENNDIFPRIKQEKNVDSTSPAPAEAAKPEKSSKKANTGPSDDPRFEITIFGLTKAHQAKFKTRGKHPVRKVLAAACKSFEIEYESVKLVHVVMTDGEEHCFELEEEECIGYCGINSESDLRIMPKTSIPLDEDDDDDNDED